MALSKTTNVLISIAFHYVEDRFRYLYNVLEHFILTYPVNVHINIQTNNNNTMRHVAARFPEYMDRLSVSTHENLSHPFDLTFQHRRYFADHLEEYDYFFYIEDDIIVPFEGFSRYAELFDELYAKGCMYSFLRYEIRDGVRYHTDTVGNEVSAPKIFQHKSRMFFIPHYPYHAFWILPRHVLNNCLQTRNDYFTNNKPRYHYRENAASYTLWALNLTPCVEICQEMGTIAECCLCHHLPNNYALNPESINAKCRIDKFLESLK